MRFSLRARFAPTGDQPAAIEKLAANLDAGVRRQTLLGVTGSGKSVIGDTPILIRTAQGVIIHEPIKELIQRLFLALPEHIGRIGNTEVLMSENIPETLRYEAYSFDPATGYASWKSIRQFIRHRSPNRLYTVTTACGRSVTITGDHNFFALRKGEIRLMRTSDMTRKDYLPLPLSLPAPDRPLQTIELSDYLTHPGRFFISMPSLLTHWTASAKILRPLLTASKTHGLPHADERVPLPLYQKLAVALPALQENVRIAGRRRPQHTLLTQPVSDALLRLFGYYIAEGHAESNYIVISSGDDEIIDDFTHTLKDMGLYWRRRPDTYDYQINSCVWSSVLAVLCGRDSRAKKLPPFWTKLSTPQLAHVLKAYFSADGGVSGQSIECTTASRILASDVAYALLRFGIVTRIHKRRMRLPLKTERRDYWRVTITGQRFLRIFSEQIGFTIEAKRRRLHALMGRPYNTNTDVIPVAGAWIRKTRTRLFIRQRDIADGCGVTRSLISFIEHGKRVPSRRTFEKIIIFLEHRADKNEDVFREIAAQRRLLQLYWTPIKNISDMPGEAFVYDVAVEENETFLAGTGGLFVHNTFTIANVIAKTQKPALVVSHNKTLAAQLYQEFKDFFPKNAVHYFVSYYDYYQPEAYIPRTDTYIEKDAKINETIDALRHGSTASLLTRDDVIIVASVSCIYGVGSPEEYQKISVELRAGDALSQKELLRRLVLLQYSRNPLDPRQGHFRAREHTVEIYLPSGEEIIAVAFEKNRIASLRRRASKDPQSVASAIASLRLFPAKHFVTPQEKLDIAIAAIRQELTERLYALKRQGKVLEAARLKSRTEFDMETLISTGYVNGIENYSRHLDFRAPGTPPHTLIDYFRYKHPDGFLTFIDESHATIPQLRGMYHGDRARKNTLVEYGFRLASATDNRPLTFDEFNEKIGQVVYVSATPAPYELELSKKSCVPSRNPPAPSSKLQVPSSCIVEQIIRPTGILDPMVEVRPAAHQMRDVIAEVKKRAAKNERSLVLALTKRISEDIAEYLTEAGIKAEYLHSEIKTLERPEILKKLREGGYEALVGINLLREGLDLPEVSFIAILDADKEGFLRNETTLLQIIGRAARHTEGMVILYGDTITGSMRAAIRETDRRRAIQKKYNEEHGITPQNIEKAIRESITEGKKHDAASLPAGPAKEVVKELEYQMKKASRAMDFERAAQIRDRIKKVHFSSAC